MDNGQAKPLEVISPATLKDAFTVFCHRFFAPLVIQAPDPLNARMMRVTAQVANVACVKEKCMMWNPDKGECWDVSAAKGQALAGQFAYNRMNDVRIDTGGV
jgi:hypothetical protein